MARLVEQCQVLKDMVDSCSATSLSGEAVPIHSNIPLAYAESLYETVRRANPGVVIEVGMAFGVASLAILSGLRGYCSFFGDEPSIGVVLARQPSIPEPPEDRIDSGFSALSRLAISLPLPPGWLLKTFSMSLSDNMNCVQ